MVIHSTYDTVLIDFETTGKYYDKDRIIQIGATLLRHKHREPSLIHFEALVNPNTAIPYNSKAQKIHKIEPSTLNDKDTFPIVFNDFKNWLRYYQIQKDTSFVLCAHNGHNFDFKFLCYEMIRHNVCFENDLRVFVADTLPMFRTWWPGTCHKLGYLYEQKTGHSLENAHNALADVKAMRILLLERNKEQGYDESQLEIDMYRQCPFKHMNILLSTSKDEIKRNKTVLKPELNYIYITYTYKDYTRKEYIKKDGGRWDAMRKQYYYPDRNTYERARIKE